MADSASLVGCTLPSTSVTRDTRVCSPEVAPSHANRNSFHEYWPPVDGSSVAACHAPSSTFTCTPRSGVPSWRTKPSTSWRSPTRVTRAMTDLTRSRDTSVSCHTVSPPISSDHRVRYHRACHLPRNRSDCTRMWESHFTLLTPYQPGTRSRSGEPCSTVRGAPFSA